MYTARLLHLARLLHIDMLVVVFIHTLHHTCVCLYLVRMPQIRYDNKLEKSHERQTNAEKQQIYKRGTTHIIPTVRYHDNN